MYCLLEFWKDTIHKEKNTLDIPKYSFLKLKVSIIVFITVFRITRKKSAKVALKRIDGRFEKVKMIIENSP